ncbi:MAG: A/G-specific adenine glycosylase [Bernardetiaceae bacterium]|nr:A/G-specific adenine glycosylase [Bernardetiaceae bacterium]
MPSNPISAALIAWFAANKRSMPWRNTKDAYKIWLSEIILQQTRVAQGMPYYERFIAHFPDVHALAAASEGEVMRLWQGLGYYSRARNLHKAAKIVSQERAGEFPNSYEDLLKLPGVGSYTAAAIASFAFGLPTAVLDGNVYRVLSRLFAIDTDISSGKAKKEFTNIAQGLLPTSESATHNQAIMELGALVCLPKNPKCQQCPLSDYCEARRLSKPQAYPVKKRKIKVKTRYFYYFIFQNEAGSLYLKKRDTSDIWASLYDFPMLESDKSLSLEEVFAVLPSQDWLLKGSSDYQKHVLTHQHLQVRFSYFKIKDTGSAWQSFLQQHKAQAFDTITVEALPKPILIANYLEKWQLSLY